VLFRVLCTFGWRSHWVLRTRVVLDVSVGTRGFHRTPFPRSLSLTGSSPRELRSSSESSASHPQSPSPATAPSLGLRPLLATSPAGVHASGFPTPAAFPSSAFCTPATVYSADRLVGLFHPTATSRVHPSGNVSRAQPIRLSTSRALSSLAPPRCLGCPKRHASSPRPQGFHPCESPWLRRRGLAVVVARSPRGFCLLQVLRLDVAPMPSHRLPLVTFMRARHCRSRTGLQRSLPPSPTSSPEAADLLEVPCLRRLAFRLDFALDYPVEIHALAENARASRSSPMPSLPRSCGRA